jgi:hypothetical protein
LIGRKSKFHAFVIDASQDLAKEGVEPTRGYNNVETHQFPSERSSRESSGKKADGSGKEKNSDLSGSYRKEGENSQPLVATGSESI